MENTIFDVRRKMYRKNGKEEIQSLGEYYNEHTWINESGKMGCSYNLAVNQTFFSFFFMLQHIFQIDAHILMSCARTSRSVERIETIN